MRGRSSRRAPASLARAVKSASRRRFVRPRLPRQARPRTAVAASVSRRRISGLPCGVGSPSVRSRPPTRAVLVRKLKLDVRGFYRDLEVLRDAGVVVELREGRYHLSESLDDARNRLPFPDPQLTVGEALEVSKGRSAAHRRLRQLIE